MTPDWTGHTRFGDPGRHAPLLRALPPDVETLAAAARNVIVHYRAQLPDFTPDRLPEVNSRWLERILDRDQARFDADLLAPRPLTERVAGCCRDHALFLAAALREHGIPARTRIGFATYLLPGWALDHVVTEYVDGDRWVRTDPEFAVEAARPGFDPRDLGLHRDAPFHTAAQAWTAYRQGDRDLARHAVFPGADGPLAGAALVGRYVYLEIAHRYGDEMLLWDVWGAAAETGEDLTAGQHEELDELAALLLAADGPGPAAREAEATLLERYRDDPRLHPGSTVLQVDLLDDSEQEIEIG